MHLSISSYRKLFDHVLPLPLLILTLNIGMLHRIIRPVLGQLMLKVYREAVVRPELIHKVCLGPFTHTVDDGLDSRKAAFECLDTLVDNCIDQLEPAAFVDTVILGAHNRHVLPLCD